MNLIFLFVKTFLCVFLQRAWMSTIEGAVTALLASPQPRVKSSSLWLESSQI